jgi:hypothetical protein
MLQFYYDFVDVFVDRRKLDFLPWRGVVDKTLCDKVI